MSQESNDEFLSRTPENPGGWRDLDTPGDRAASQPASTCDGVRLLFVPMVDGEASSAEQFAVEAHVASCLSCSRELEMHRQIALAITSSRSSSGFRAADPELAERVRRAARAPRHAWDVRRWPAWTARVAACLALGGIIWFLSRSPSESPTPSDELLGSLDVLEALQAEGLEPSPELAQALLDVVDGDLGAAHGDESIDLPWEELSQENL